MTDIDRLRRLYESIHDSTTNGAPSPVVVERADAIIAALEAENERLRRERERAENAMRRYKLAPRRVPGL